MNPRRRSCGAVFVFVFAAALSVWCCAVANAAFVSESRTASPSDRSKEVQPRAGRSDSETKHPLEDDKSWRLHLERRSGHWHQNARNGRRGLLEQGDGGKDFGNDDDDDEEFYLPFEIKHKPRKSKHIKIAGGDTTHGMMIDAGSQGTRLHIYEWRKRFLLDEDDLIEQTKGRKLSYPTSHNRWTDKYTPGLDAFGSIKHPHHLEQAVGDYLGALLDFAREVLRDKEAEWSTYPIYLKATGGLRTLPQPERLRLMDCVRKLFHNTTFNPFAFEDERARVISGEEEAIYGWVGVNFAKGLLIENSMGTGTGKDPRRTYGMLEMGGASTQVAVFENNGDLMANLFKLQLGGARHWNVYVHSYLYFGINGAWSRLNAWLHGENKTTNPCLPLGKEVVFDSWIHVGPRGHFYPRSDDPKSVPYSVTMVHEAPPSGGSEPYDAEANFQDCSNRTFALLRKGTNSEWCDFQMDGNCGFAGIYQPPMPQTNSENDEFIATSNFYDVFQFLQLGETANVSQIGKAARDVCMMDWPALVDYNEANEMFTVKTDHELAQFCFRSLFVYHLIRNGWEFGDDYRMTAVDVIDGHKLGWALGCMLYEINTLPWDFHPELLYKGTSKILVALYVVLGTLGGSIVGLMIAMRLNKRINEAVRKSVIFQNHPEFANNPLVRKSLALPKMDLDELESLYNDGDEDEDQDDRQEDQTAALNRSKTPGYSAT